MTVIAASAVFTARTTPYVAVTLAQMKAIEDPTLTPYVRCVDDGRNGDFEWVGGDKTAAVDADPQGGITVESTQVAKTLGAWVRSYSEAINVKWFGTVGDGVANDTAAIQGALNVATAGSAILFPRGTYGINANLTLSAKAGIKIQGDNATITDLTSGTLTRLLHLNNMHDVVVDGLAFDGQETQAYFLANTPTAVRTCIFVENSDRPTVRNIYGKGKRTVVRIDNSSHYASVSGIKFTGFLQDLDTGILADGKESQAVVIRSSWYASVTDVTAQDCGSCLLVLNASKYLTISGVVGSNLHDNGVYVSSGDYVTVTGCVFKKIVGDGVQARGSHITIADNVAEDARSGGFSVTPYAAGQGFASVTGNIARACAYLVRIGTATSFYLSDVVVSANVGDGLVGTAAISALDMLPPAGRANYVITNNVVRGHAGDYGCLITGQASERITFSGNIIEDINGSAASTRGGVRIGSVIGLVAVGNTFADIASSIGIRCLGVTDGVIANNIYIGGQVVRAPAAESNTGLMISNNLGATLVVDGLANIIGPNDATVTGFPAITKVPQAVGERTYVAGAEYVATGIASSSDWKQTTP